VEHEQELLAIIEGLEKFDLLLRGRRIFAITDNKSLTFDLPKKPSKRQVRWQDALGLSAYEVTINYIKGFQNTLADALSRNPVAPPGEVQEDERFLVGAIETAKRVKNRRFNSTRRTQMLSRDRNETKRNCKLRHSEMPELKSGQNVPHFKRLNACRILKERRRWSNLRKQRNSLGRRGA
jgi:hypothetical protein